MRYALPVKLPIRLKINSVVSVERLWVKSSRHRILSRLLHSPRKGYIRASVGGSVHFLALFDEKDNGFVDTTHRSFSSLIRSSSHVRGLISTNCLNKGLGVRCSVSLDRETPLIDTYSSHRSMSSFR